MADHRCDAKIKTGPRKNQACGYRAKYSTKKGWRCGIHYKKKSRLVDIHRTGQKCSFWDCQERSYQDDRLCRHHREYPIILQREPKFPIFNLVWLRDKQLYCEMKDLSLRKYGYLREDNYSIWKGGLFIFHQSDIIKGIANCFGRYLHLAAYQIDYQGQSVAVNDEQVIICSDQIIIVADYSTLAFKEFFACPDGYTISGISGNNIIVKSEDKLAYLSTDNELSLVADHQRDGLVGNFVKYHLYQVETEELKKIDCLWNVVTGETKANPFLPEDRITGISSDGSVAATTIDGPPHYGKVVNFYRHDRYIQSFPSHDDDQHLYHDGCYLLTGDRIIFPHLMIYRKLRAGYEPILINKCSACLDSSHESP